MHQLCHKHLQQWFACWQVDAEVCPPMMEHHKMHPDTCILIGTNTHINTFVILLWGEVYQSTHEMHINQ